MVNHIEEFGPELEIETFPNPRVLEQGYTHILVAGTAQDVPSRIAEAPVVRENESLSVEPLFGCPILKLAGSNPVGTIIGAEAQARDAGVAVIDLGQEGNRERPSALQGYDSVGGPSAEQCGNETAAP